MLIDVRRYDKLLLGKAVSSAGSDGWGFVRCGGRTQAGGVPIDRVVRAPRSFPSARVKGRWVRAAPQAAGRRCLVTPVLVMWACDPMCWTETRFGERRNAKSDEEAFCSQAGSAEVHGVSLCDEDRGRLGDSIHRQEKGFDVDSTGSCTGPRRNKKYEGHMWRGTSAWKEGWIEDILYYEK